MDPLWLLKGSHEAPGWRPLEADSRADKIELLLFDRTAWALVRAPGAPAAYPGLSPVTPPDGLARVLGRIDAVRPAREAKRAPTRDLPVAAVEAHVVGEGKVGAITKKLMDAFKEFFEAATAKR